MDFGAAPIFGQGCTGLAGSGGSWTVFVFVAWVNGIGPGNAIRGRRINFC